MKVIGSRVLLEIIEKDNSVGGIVMPDSVEKETEYKVVDIGDYVDSVAVGDYVLLEKYTGTEIVKDKKRYLIVEEEEIIAVVKK